MKSYLRQFWLCLIAALAFLGSGAVWAEEGSGSHSTILVTAIVDQGPEDVDLGLVKRNLATDMKDVFKMESSIEIGGGSRGAQRIYVRGIEATNLNVTIDGAAQGMNHFQHRGNIGGINPDLLKQVEVQTMPSADQGPGALGGSIRFETVDAQDLLEDNKIVGATLRSGWSSVDRGKVGGVSTYAQTGALGLLLNYTQSTFDPYQDGDGRRIVGSEGEDTDLFFKLSLLEMEGHSLRFSAEKQKDQGLYTGDWTYGDGTSRTPTNQISERETFVFDHRFRSTTGKLIDWKLNAYLNESTLERSGGETLSDGSGLDLRNTARFSFGPTEHALTLGLDWREENGESRNAGVKDPTNVEVKNVGFYLQNRMTLSRFLFSFGLRLDDYDTTFSNVNVGGDKLSPNVGLDVDLGLGFSGYVSYGEAVRGTGIIPIGWLVDTVAAATINQQPGKDSYGKRLKAESSETYECGLRFKRQNLLYKDDHCSAQVAVFDTEIKNLLNQIGGVQGKPVTGFYNDDPITSQGYEVKAGWGLGGCDTNLSFTHAVTEDKDGKAVAFSRRTAASAGDTLVWDVFWKMNPQLTLGYTWKLVGSLHRDEIDRDGYNLHNAQIAWSPSFCDGLNLTLAALNIFDRQYRSQASSGDDDTAAPEPGRDIRVGLTYKVQF
ncbi:MAG: TonB-dependent receptor plug domain-containing protein [Deltaproteobacteria bacterium]|nr:TonB-dependent receptor plug domain-containing protein [Deltaproteobacteria bacterium]